MPVTEAELKERAVAPRVTLEYLESQIASEHYFTGTQGALGGLEADGVPATPFERVNTPETLRCLTFCILVMKNGFTVTGQSACADPANYKQDIGERIARQDAINKVWPLLGYELRTKLSLVENLVPTPAPTWFDRLRDERTELADRVTKLNKYVGTEAYSQLPHSDQLDLSEQLFAMGMYLEALTRRLVRAGT